MLSDARELDRCTLYTGGLEAKFQTVLLGMSDESASCTSGEVGSGSEDRSAEEQDEDEGLSRDEHSPSEGSHSDGDTDGSHLGGDVIDSSSCSSAPSSSDHATDDTSCSTEEDGLEETWSSMYHSRATRGSSTCADSVPITNAHVAAGCAIGPRGSRSSLIKIPVVRWDPGSRRSMDQDDLWFVGTATPS